MKYTYIESVTNGELRVILMNKLDEYCTTNNFKQNIVIDAKKLSEAIPIGAVIELGSRSKPKKGLVLAAHYPKGIVAILRLDTLDITVTPITDINRVLFPNNFKS